MKEYHNVAEQVQQPQAPASDTAGVLKSVNLISVLVGVLLAIGMIADQHSVTMSILVGGCAYGLVAVLLILFQPGGLPWIIVNGQREKTIRLRDRMQYSAIEAQAERQQWAVVPPAQLPHVDPVAPLALPQMSNFVPAIPPADERLKLACYQFVRALFDEGGKPLPKRILGEHTKSPGLVQYEKPKPDVVEYMTGLQMVWTNERKQLFFNVRDYPSLRYCVNAIKLGTPAGREEQPSSTPQPLPQLHEYERGSA